jgi:hypothetical protein
MSMRRDTNSSSDAFKGIEGMITERYEQRLRRVQGHQRYEHGLEGDVKSCCQGWRRTGMGNEKDKISTHREDG